MKIIKFAGKTGAYFTTAYLFLMFCIYPFYIENGYKNIGEAKNRFFITVSFAALVIFLILFIICTVGRIIERRNRGEAYLIDWDKVSVTELMMLLYATAVFLSYVLSNDKEETLWGTEGWHLGCIPLILMCGLAFLISYLWDEREKLLYGIVLASGLVFLLGICNRFSYYPIPIEAARADFISTLGNINWFCGFMSVVAPIGISLFVLSERKEGKVSAKSYFLGIYVFLTFVAGFAQGSSSIFLWYGALFFILLWIAVQKRNWIQNYIILMILWALSAQLVRLMRYLLPENYNYDTNSLCGYLTDSGWTLWIVVLAILLYFSVIAIEKKTDTKKMQLHIRQGMCVVILVIIFVWIVLSVLNTKMGIPGLSENSLFLWNDDWGNGRGITISVGIQMFGEMSWLQRFIGVGPDGFAGFAYSVPEITVRLQDYFGSSRLTNAHCELLTNLINIGIVGTVFYIGIFISLVYRCMKEGRRKQQLYVIAVCIVCYFLHNLVSFAQVLNIPFLFLLLGMGENIIRKK